MAKATPATSANKVKLYEQLIASSPEVERKGAIMPYTSRNGHMFSVMTKTGTMALRLPPDAREAFLKRFKTRLCEMYGTVMREYVEVPDALLARTAVLHKYFELSYEYVGSLKPKATTRKTKAAKKR